MRDISIARTLPIAASSIRSALGRVVEELASQSARGELSLHASLPNAPGIRIDVAVALRGGSAVRNDVFPIRIEARSHAGMFPTFVGSVELHAVGRAVSNIRLAGAYDVPLGMLGAILDATAMRDLARGNLATVLERLVEDVEANLRRSVR